MAQSTLRVYFIDDDFVPGNEIGETQIAELREILAPQGIEADFLAYDQSSQASAQITEACRRICAEPEDDRPLTDVVVLDVMFPGGGGTWEETGLRKGLPILRDCGVPVVIRTSVRGFKKMSEIAGLATDESPYVVKSLHPNEDDSFVKELDAWHDRDLPTVIRDLVARHPRPTPLGTGVLVTHGTDTLAWGLSVLKYMLKGLDTNVVLTGSMVPLDDVAFADSDAIGNVKSSLQVMTAIRPPSISVVFGRGVDVFSEHITKINQIDAKAFMGRTRGRVGQNEVTLERDTERYRIKAPVRRLHVIATGGTIDSKREAGKGFTPSGDFVKSYISAQLKNYYGDLSTNDISKAVDSSNMHLDRWREVAEIIDNEIAHDGKSDKTGFDDKIRVLYLSPFETSQDLLEQAKGRWSGFVLLGYGSGNGNIEGCRDSKIDEKHPSFPLGYCGYLDRQIGLGTLPTEGFDPTPYFGNHPCRGFSIPDFKPCPNRSPGGAHNVIEFIHVARALGKFVILGSQVVRGPCDFEYETGRNLIRAGAIPAADMSVAEAQVKLSYVLGHRDAIAGTVDKLAASGHHAVASEHQLVSACLLAGTRFRHEAAQDRYFRLMADLGHPVYLLQENPFVFRQFDEAIDLVAECMAAGLDSDRRPEVRRLRDGAR